MMDQGFEIGLNDIKTRFVGNEGIKAKLEKPMLVATNRPVELMLDVTEKEPEFFQGKRILNVGAGRTHWGLDLTSKYGVVAREFENMDIKYAGQPLARRVVGKLLGAENVGDVHARIPYGDGEFDLVWCSVAPTNFREFWRVLRPGGKAYALPISGELVDMIRSDLVQWKIKEKLSGNADVTVKPIDEEIGRKYSVGKYMLVLSKPSL